MAGASRWLEAWAGTRPSPADRRINKARITRVFTFLLLLLLGRKLSRPLRAGRPSPFLPASLVGSTQRRGAADEWRLKVLAEGREGKPGKVRIQSGDERKRSPYPSWRPGRRRPASDPHRDRRPQVC